MRVLGISPLDKDSTVSFMEDGRVVFACGEERLSRVKLQTGFPEKALALGLEKTGWELSSIDKVAYAFFDGDEEERLMNEAAAADAEWLTIDKLQDSARLYATAVENCQPVDQTIKIPGHNDVKSEYVPKKAFWKRQTYEFVARNAKFDLKMHKRYYKQWLDHAIAEHHRWNVELISHLTKRDLQDKLVRFHHHDTHAANAFYASGYEDALVVVLDAYGSGCCGGVYVADDSGVEQLHRYRFPNSLGVFYEQVTSGLGFRPSRHEGKIVGLAAYGNTDLLSELLLSRFDTTDGDIKLMGAHNFLLTRAMAAHFSRRDVAAAYQNVLEIVSCRSVEYWLKKTGKRRIVMSGGVHANVKLNQRIREVAGVDSVFVYPNMGDGGCATGAALLAFDKEVRPRIRVSNVYYGPEFSDAEIENELKSEGLEYESCDDVEMRIAEVLANDSIVARFNGRMEYGPRALGNRSILYPARQPEVNQWLNEQLGRTEFMPFAPVVLASAGPQLFKNIDGCEDTAEFMTITFDCTDQMIQHSPAAVHVDGTARPQFVTQESNESVFQILTNYEKLTGIPVLINTSFNMHEEPIVCSPKDAVRAFLLGNLHYLAAGRFLVRHPSMLENTAKVPLSKSL